VPPTSWPNKHTKLSCHYCGSVISSFNMYISEGVSDLNESEE
jgi:hypothetical protein